MQVLNMDFKNEPPLLNSKEKTYVYLWTYAQFQQEQAEWDCVNKRLQNHGFKPVFFADPVENKNISDLVLLDKRTAAEVRVMMKTMLGDSDRRQALIQELVQSNNQLKDEAQQLMGQAGLHSRCTTEMEGLLEGVRGQVQDLEDRCLAQAVQQRDHAYRLQQDKLMAQRLAVALQLQLTNESTALGELQRKLCFAVREEERRVARQTDAFQRIHASALAQQDTPADQRVLDVIDFYETQIAKVQDDMSSRDLLGIGFRTLNGGPEGSQGSNWSAGVDVTSSFKAELKSSQAQLEETKVQREELKAEVQRLKKELETRPPTSGASTGNPSDAAAPPGQVSQEGVLCGQYQRLLIELEAILTGARAPVALLRQRAGLGQLEPQEFGWLRPTLEAWANQLAMLKELHVGLMRLSQRLMPWLPAGDHDDRRGGVAMETVWVEDLMLLVDTLLVDKATEDENDLSSPTRHSLQCMVGHFQKLFDVGSLRGVYPRMNDLYRRLAETANAMTHIRDLLGLDNKAPPSEVVNQVATISSSPMVQFHHLLAEGDLTSIIVKVKEHEEFFPAFRSLATQLMLTLDVDCLDGILPALTSLKLKSQ
ncbi:centrosomal protein of 70 kDa isoform X1 [Gadus morhua]|uniref:centrosomal protein of 70 kDa isoform X1 n=1 Tax=Gadus morhua TaxID=8049 RepID=UPI0011B484B9|nr:centrosomal protein of 70 kDa isoform X1 [Gadus morhua]